GQRQGRLGIERLAHAPRLLTVPDELGQLNSLHLQAATLTFAVHLHQAMVEASRRLAVEAQLELPAVFQLEEQVLRDAAIDVIMNHLLYGPPVAARPELATFRFERHFASLL